MTKTHKQFIDLYYYYPHRTQTEWAKEFCVTNTTITRWVQRYSKELEEKRQEIIGGIEEKCKKMLINTADNAIQTIIDLLDCNNDNVRYNTARYILDFLGVSETNAITDSDFQIVVNIPESIRKTQNNDAD
jgi:hypothetical protein